MAIARTALSEADLRTLVRGPSEDERATAVHKLCRRMDWRLKEADRVAAVAVLRLVARDPSEQVRRALAVTLKGSPMLPRDLALRLAAEEDSVASPVLTHSPVLTEDDLAQIARAASRPKQRAIAQRKPLCAATTRALVDHADEHVVRTALMNADATFSAAALNRVSERFPGLEDLVAAVVQRSPSRAPVARAVDEARSASPAAALQRALAAPEPQSGDLVDQVAVTGEQRALVLDLRSKGQLTPSLLLRAAAHGRLAFLEWSLAELSGVPHHRTWLMVHDAGALGLRAICEKAGVPHRLFPAFRAAVDAYHALQREGEVGDLILFQQRMLQRFLTQPHEDSEDLDYLLDRLEQLSRELKNRGEAVRDAAA